LGFGKGATALKKGSKVFKYERKMLDYTISDFLVGKWSAEIIPFIGRYPYKE
jgi:hypothetical protein